MPAPIAALIAVILMVMDTISWTIATCWAGRGKGRIYGSLIQGSFALRVRSILTRLSYLKRQ
jgi:hypothetical protein